MLSSSTNIPKRTVLNIDNCPDGCERLVEKNQSPAAVTRHCDCDPDYEPGFESQALAGLRILVVDDEPDCATLTGYMLSQWGADVKVVISASEALEVFERYEEWPPDILISDIQMPAIDGYGLMRRVRKMDQDRGGDIPAIALTAFTRVEDRIRALVAGFQIHIAKPFEPVELLTVVESIVNRRGDDRRSGIEN
jgi:CheY-like chemotaxis protein